MKRTVGLDVWSDRLLANPASKVIRTFLVSKDQYENSLDKTDFNGNRFSKKDQEKILKGIPHLFWLSEISTIDLYCANKTKIIDFLYGCDPPKWKDANEMAERWLKIRLPSALLTRDLGSPPTLDTVSISSHYPLLKFQNQQDSLDC